MHVNEAELAVLATYIVRKFLLQFYPALRRLAVTAAYRRRRDQVCGPPAIGGKHTRAPSHEVA
jgi:hypothetical protein